MILKNRWNEIKKLHKRLDGVTIEYDLSIYKSILEEIDGKGACYSTMTDRELQLVSLNLKNRALNRESLECIYTEAFALVRETLHRVLHITPFDEQVLGGIVLFKNRLAEMQTGEGKTLTAVFPAYVNALTGKGVHILTFNDYLARRDAEWMGPVFEFLGVSVAYINQGMSSGERKMAYLADITYLTAKECGFDYLRDSMCYYRDEIVHRPLHYAIIDEADSILIDEARTPLVIAGATNHTISDTQNISDCVADFEESVEYDFDEYKRNIMLTEKGINKIETTFGCGNLYDESNLDLLSRVHYALHAHFLLQINRDYIVKNNAIEMVDECTGRVADRRKWPDGLHEAVELKERCPIGKKGKILNTLTLQHFLQLYPRLCGMSATAQVAEEELRVFYNLHITVIPPHRTCIRKDTGDYLFKTREVKFTAIIEEILRVHATGQPLLVGTQSIVESEKIAHTLRSKNVPCNVLNARNNEHEALIIAEAGAIGAVTISTNMAGRGTDIRLGGSNQEQKDTVSALGGLYVIGTNRFESRRIDNQLRGRAARQGDPGLSTFFISLEDDLFVKYKLHELLPESVSNLNSPKITQEIDRVQRIIEGQHLEIKIDLFKYTSLLEQQREILFEKRSAFLFDDIIVLKFFEQSSPERFRSLKEILTPDGLIRICRLTALLTIDNCWSSYLMDIEALKDGIHLQRIGGQDPLFEFRKISIEMFRELLGRIDSQIITVFNEIEIKNGNVDLENFGLKQPSATWTYLVNDDPFERKFGMQMVSNICFNAAAGFLWPITMLMLFIKKWRKSSR
jgi:preprotein translocase subunit SecA